MMDESSRWTFKSLGFTAGLALLLLFCGCGFFQNGRAQQLGLIPVSGVVEMDGLPIASAVVIMEHEDGSHSRGTTDANGQFRMMFDSETPGVLPGPKVVRISKYDIPNGQHVESEDYETLAHNLIPPRYNRKSQLEEVISTETTFLKFELKSGNSR